MRGCRLSEITYEEAQRITSPERIVVLPIGGGTKEHGPQLPCGTDLYVVEALADALVERCDVLMLPALAYAYYPAFVDWPGSISIRPTAFIEIVEDIVSSMARHGSRKFLLLDGGVSTQFPLRVACSELTNKLGVKMALTNIVGLGEEEKNRVCERESGGHADESETSCMCYLHPRRVKMDRAVKEIGTSAAMTGSSGVVKVAVAGKMGTRSGINGVATLATPAKGEAIIKAMIEDLVAFVERY